MSSRLRGSPSPLLCPGEVAPAGLCPVLGSPEEEEQGTTGESTKWGGRDAKGLEHLFCKERPRD